MVGMAESRKTKRRRSQRLRSERRKAVKRLDRDRQQPINRKAHAARWWIGVLSFLAILACGWMIYQHRH